MSKKLLKILRMITRDFKELDLYAEEAAEGGAVAEADLSEIGEELAAIESSARLDEEELDILRSNIAYILLRQNAFDQEEIYSLVFGGGKRIIWN